MSWKQISQRPETVDARTFGLKKEVSEVGVWIWIRIQDSIIKDLDEKD